MDISLLKLEQVVAGYQQKPILNGTSMEVPLGFISCVVGPNGSGKSTLIKCIMGLLPAWQGKVYLAEKEITRLSPLEISRLGAAAVLQGRTSFGTLTVRENLELGGYLLNKTTRNQRIEEIFAQFPGLLSYQNQKASNLSSGWQQILEISRAFMLHPRLLILDEPTLGLSPTASDLIFELILGLKKAGRTVLMVEQNAKKALEISDYAFVLDLGRVCHTDKAASLLVNEKLKRLYLGYT